MRKLSLVLLPTIALFGCGDAADEPASPPLDVDASATPLDGAEYPESLVGEWRVAGVDGEDINLPYGISASITETLIEISADCTYLHWVYSYEAGELSAEQMPALTCDRALEPLEAAIEETFDSAERVILTPGNAMMISGGGHTVELYSQ